MEFDTPDYDVMIVGAGRVGQTLGRLLVEAGVRVTRVACRSRAAAEQAVAFIGAGEPHTCESLARQPASAHPEVLLLTTPDAAIASTALRLAPGRATWHGVTVLHCSGALSSTVLQGLGQHGAALGSMHPLHAFGSALAAPASLRGVHWCIEGDATAKQLARQMIALFQGVVSDIEAHQKILYHAAAAVAGNLLTGLFSLAVSMLEHCGIAREQGRAMLLPLSEGVLQRLRSAGELAALAGPIDRGDAATVAQHVLKLRELPPVYLEVYRSLSRELVELARQKGTPAALLADIEHLLRDPGS
ncbi:MAG: Rossmann-like and DUF2520 domain-containing protein [Candidatus Tectimicrobiota bacterium]